MERILIYDLKYIFIIWGFTALATCNYTIKQSFFQVSVSSLVACPVDVVHGPYDTTGKSECAIRCCHLVGCAAFQSDQKSCWLATEACEIHGPGVMYLDTQAQVLLYKI